MSSPNDYKAEVQPRIADVPGEAWDACANPDPSRFDPFVSHAFLKALEDVQGWPIDGTTQKLHLQDKDGKTLLIFSAL